MFLRLILSYIILLLLSNQKSFSKVILGLVWFLKTLQNIDVGLVRKELIKKSFWIQ